MKHFDPRSRGEFRTRPSRPSCAPDPREAVRPGLRLDAKVEQWPHTRLAGSWSDLLEDMAPLGQLAVRTRHDSAELLAAGPYPELDFSPDRLWAVNAERRLSLDFTCWQEVWAVEEISGNQIHCRIEAFDAEGANVHSLLLDADADTATFRKLTAFYRSDERGSEWRSARPRASAPWQGKLSQRAAWVRALGEAGSEPLPPSVLAEVFQSVQTRRLTMLAGIYTQAVIHRQTCRFLKTGCTDEWLWAWGGNAGVRVAPARLAGVWCVGGRCACCGEDRWTLEGYNGERQLAFTLQAVDEGREAE